jgi:hypothetical protein
VFGSGFGRRIAVGGPTVLVIRSNATNPGFPRVRRILYVCRQIREPERIWSDDDDPDQVRLVDGGSVITEREEDSHYG